MIVGVDVEVESGKGGLLEKLSPEERPAGDEVVLLPASLVKSLGGELRSLAIGGKTDDTGTDIGTAIQIPQFTFIHLKLTRNDCIVVSLPDHVWLITTTKHREGVIYSWGGGIALDCTFGIRATR